MQISGHICVALGEAVNHLSIHLDIDPCPSSLGSVPERSLRQETGLTGQALHPCGMRSSVLRTQLQAAAGFFGPRHAEHWPLHRDAGRETNTVWSRTTGQAKVVSGGGAPLPTRKAIRL